MLWRHVRHLNPFGIWEGFYRSWLNDPEKTRMVSVKKVSEKITEK